MGEAQFFRFVPLKSALPGGTVKNILGQLLWIRMTSSLILFLTWLRLILATEKYPIRRPFLGGL